MEKQFGRKVAGARFTCLLGVVLTALLGAGTTQAATVSCDCDAGCSLQATINSLDLVGPHTINATGTCRENILLDQRDRLTIQGAPPSQTATISSPTSTVNVVNIFRSHAIALRRLVITGGGRGVFLRHGSELRIESSRIENNATGLFAIENSTVLVGGPQAAQAVAITNNGGGIFLNGGFLTIGGFTTIDNNPNGGLAMQGGRSFVQGPGNSVRGNGRLGVFIQRGAALDLGGVDVSNNLGPGVLAAFNAVVFLGNATVTNNTEDGVRVIRGAAANIGPANILTGNGGADLACDTTGLVVLVGDQTITKVNCMRIERELGPPRPGEIVDLPDPPEP